MTTIKTTDGDEFEFDDTIGMNDPAPASLDDGPNTFDTVDAVDALLRKFAQWKESAGAVAGVTTPDLVRMIGDMDYRIAIANEDLDARILAMTPAENKWPGSNDEQRRTARDRAIACDDVCQKLKAIIDASTRQQSAAKIELKARDDERVAHAAFMRDTEVDLRRRELALFEEFEPMRIAQREADVVAIKTKLAAGEIAELRDRVASVNRIADRLRKPAAK